MYICTPLVVEAASSVIIGLRDFETAARASVQCDTGKCVDVSLLAVQFSSSVCQDVLQGLDVHWAALFILFLLSLLAVILVLFLTNRFVDVELERRSSRNKTNRISLMDTLVSQLQGTVWLLFSLSVDLWWVVSVEKDEYFHAHCTGEEGAGCCASCVWGFGLTFLLISIIAGSSSQIYQSIIIYQLHSEYAFSFIFFWVGGKVGRVELRRRVERGVGGREGGRGARKERSERRVESYNTQGSSHVITSGGRILISIYCYIWVLSAWWSDHLEVGSS